MCVGRDDVSIMYICRKIWRKLSLKLCSGHFDWEDEMKISYDMSSSGTVRFCRKNEHENKIEK